MALTLLEQQQLVKVAVGMFDAAPGGVYLNEFTNFVLAGNSVKTLVNALTLSPAFQAPAFFPNSLTNGQFAVKFIDQLVGTDAAVADKAWAASWMEGMLNAGVSRGDAIYEAVSALDAVPDTNAAWGTAAKAFDNKVVVAQYYSVVAAGAATDVQQLQAVIANVTATSDVSTPAAIQAIIQASGSSSGAIFVLTPGGDFADTAGSIRNIVGGTSIPSDFKFTTLNETITATSATLAAIDTLVDGSTTDNDVMNLAFSAGTVAGIFTNIETFRLTATNIAPSALVLDPAGVTPVTGLKSITISGAPAAALAVLHGPAGTTVGDTGVTNIDGSGLTTTVSSLTVDSSTAVSNAALTMIGGAGGDFLLGGLGSDTISGGANGDFLSGGAANDTLNGDAGNDGLAGGQQNDTLNGGTGADALAGGANNDTFTGGAGNDILGMNAVPAANTVAGVIAAVEADAGAVAGQGNDTVVFGADLAANGADIVYGFTAGGAGAVGGGDVLNVSAFLGAAVVLTTAAAATINAPNTFAASGANVATWGAQAGVDTDANGVLSFAELDAARTLGWIDLGNSAKIVIAYDDTVGGAIPAAAGPGFAASTPGAALHYVTTSATGAIATVELVGIVDAVVSTNLLANNFA